MEEKARIEVVGGILWRGGSFLAAQRPEGHLELADTQHVVLPEIFKVPFGRPQVQPAPRLAAQPDGVGLKAGDDGEGDIALGTGIGVTLL